MGRYSRYSCPSGRVGYLFDDWTAPASSWEGVGYLGQILISLMSNKYFGLPSAIRNIIERT